jgi:hypothetical protein
LPPRADSPTYLSKKNGASNSLWCQTSVCNACPVKNKCTGSKSGRHIFRSFFQEYLDKAETYRQTEAYLKAMRKRSVWIEPLFGEAKEFHGLRRFRLRRLRKVNIEDVMVAAGQNLKRLIQHYLAKLFSLLISPFSAFDFPTNFDFFNRLLHCANNIHALSFLYF